MKKNKTGKRKAIKMFSAKSHLAAMGNLQLADKFPLKEPLQIIVASADWQQDKPSDKKREGIASFVLSC